MGRPGDLASAQRKGGLPAAPALVRGGPLIETPSRPIMPFAVGAAVVLMLFAGIHNSWDSISYHVFVVRNGPTDTESRDG
ncbi:MAG TPA: hypothetical protein VMV37_05395 [Gammaproteobacteria bacterium]|nr:hypothetical protein [Gammaproteobacteria bacterium]